MVSDNPGFFPARELGIQLGGYLYIYPCKANYLGGDIISGVVASDMTDRQEISVFLDIGTNGELVVGSSPKISRREGELCVSYAPGLYFYQSDIDEFIKTEAAAGTMVAYMLDISGIPMEEVDRFFVAGAFGTHINKEAAVNIGLYPDMDRDQIISLGNASLAGARRLLLDRSILGWIPRILDLMQYVQFGALENFLELMRATSVFPHMDLTRYPTVAKKLAERRKGSVS